MFEDFEFEDFNPAKRIKSEEQVTDDLQIRPQARFAAQLVEVYYLRSSRLKCEQSRKEGNEMYSLDDMVQSLAQQVGATVHHFQLIDKRCVPASFARSNVPLEPPRRPFLASVLAVLVQAFVFESGGAYISLSTFDEWFSSVSGVDGAPISRCWVEAKMHVAKCLASKNKVAVFGQEIIWRHFSRLQGIHCLRDRVLWMIRASVDNRIQRLQEGGGIHFAPLLNEERRMEWRSDFTSPKECFLWPIWSKAFLCLCVSNSPSLEEKLMLAEKLFIQGVENCVTLISQITQILNGETIDEKYSSQLLDFNVFCSGTSGEFAAVCLFSALKCSLNAYFSGEPTTKFGVELATNVMSKLFCQLIEYYLFASPSPRHYHFLDACQSLWRESGATHQAMVFAQPFTPRRQERTSFVFQENAFKRTNTEVFSSYEADVCSVTPLFSACVLNGFRSREKLEKLVSCIRFQHQKLGMLCSEASDDHLLPPAGAIKLSDSLKPVTDTESLIEGMICTSWCILELPAESPGENALIESFLRSEADSLIKKGIDKAAAVSNSESGSQYTSFAF
ncbi:hypothetical protein DQ04_02191150 [Trypanosoma grayi]|uniref:hypothetical protein n=1 Tax=Trypanosoma grayi TaxID=71804 RepID=UPI0004F42B10|nr:hypothetical protein DQ04_02191150 [Trypanosoma grayi]KEG11883.1 hypothetical protein DQ04_02191150 [Trypanosoma grayi]